MFDIGWQELFIVAIIGILVVGPKDLPKAIRTVTFYLRKARGLAREFQSGLDDVVREAELDDLKKQMDDTANFDIAGEIEKTIDPTGDLSRDITEMEIGLENSTQPDAAQPFEGEAAEPEEDDISAPEQAGDTEETPETASKAGG
jgi:sec-independent protein translocase protein TatB